MPNPFPLPACYVAVLLAVLAFFALRPGKGWLRRKPLPATLEDGSDGKASSIHDGDCALAPGGGSSSGSQQHTALPICGGLEPLPAVAVSSLALQPAAAASSDLRQDTLLTPSRSAEGSLLDLDTFLPYSSSTAEAVPTPRTTAAAAAAAPEDSLVVDTFLPFESASVETAPTAAPAPPPVDTMAAAGAWAPYPSPEPLPLSYITSAGLGAAVPAAEAPAQAPHTATHSSGSR